MLRRGTFLLYSSLERGWRDKTILPNNRTGHFNIDEAATELDLDPEYAASLFRPIHYNYSVKGQRYPGEQGRSSRPGSWSSSRDRLFPMYKRNYKMDKELRKLDWRRVTTQ